MGLHTPASGQGYVRQLTVPDKPRGTERTLIPAKEDIPVPRVTD